MQPGSPNFVPGERLLDRFRIDAVHEGGMGLLSLVTDTHTGRRFAVKTVKEHLRQDPAVLARFLEEARTWIDLETHPNLVQALWLVDMPRLPLLFLEYVDGPDLARLLEKGPILLPRALDFAMQCARGMAYAHGKPLSGGIGIVHRDLKPANILITSDDVLKISDFGLARVFRGRPVDGAEPQGLGTPAYMAPEQLQSAGAVDGRADIYSFGLLLYEMVSGANPLRAEAMQEQIEKILHVLPPPLADVPAALAGLVSRCVAKSPADRPRDFPEVLAHLAAIAREFDHPWHIDPRSIPAPSEPAGIAMSPVALRPRRPRAGEPFAVELEIRGDLGPGPVELRWRLPEGDGLRVLTPDRTAVLRVEAGGSVHLALRHHLVAASEGGHTSGESTLEIAGPTGSDSHTVPPFAVEATFAFHPPLVGRDEEQGRIAELLRLTPEGRGGALILFGDVGSGKSRLLVEASRMAAEAGVRAVWSRAQGTGMRPMRILHDVARDLLDLPQGDPRTRPGADRVADAVNRILGDDPASARYFGEVLLGGAGVEEEAPPAHPWYALLSRASRRTPLVLLLDDLHMADETAIGILLDTAARVAEERLPVSLLATVGAFERDPAVHRREERIRAAIQAHAREGLPFATAALRPLNREEVHALVSAAFPGHGFAEEAPWLLDAIAGQTSGNVFHVTEILRALRVGPDAPIRRVGGEWRLAGDFSAERFRDLIPGALEAGVRRRLEVLRPATREILDLAALAGEEFDVALLKAAVEDAAAVDRAVEDLEEADLLEPVDADLDRYRFRSAIVPPVVERALHESAPRRSRRLHLAIAEGMLRVYAGERLTRRALAVAHHLEAGGEGARSIAYTLDGCERLLSLQLPERARRLLAAAEPLVTLPGVTPAQRVRFRFLYGVACEAAGDYAVGLEALTRYVEEAVETGFVADPRSLARGYTRLGRIHQARGEYDRAEYCFGVARQLLEEVGDRRSLAFCYNALAALAIDRGELLRARVHLMTATALASETGNDASALQAGILGGQLALELGDLAGARRAFLDAETRARHLGDRRRLAAALDGLGQVSLRAGYLVQAQRHTKDSLEMLAAVGDRIALARTLLHLGMVHRARGRVERALREFRRAQRVFTEVGHAEGVALARLAVGSLQRLRGRTTIAIRELAAASEELSRLASPDRIRAWRELAEALSDSGSLPAARIAFVRADRSEPPGPSRLGNRVISRALRADLYLSAGDLRRAQAWADRAARHARRAGGHQPRIAANLSWAEVALHAGDLHAARRCADTALAFANEQGEPLAAARAERVLLELDARAGRREEVRERAHRVARAYTGRSDVGDGPARLLLALGRGLERTAPARAGRYLKAARACYARLEAQGFRRVEPS